MFLQGLRTTCIKVGSYSIMTAHLCKPVLVKIKGSSNHTLVIQIRIPIYVRLLLFCLFLFFPVKFLVVKPIHSSNKSGYILSYYKHKCSRNMVWGWGRSCLELPNSSCISFKKKTINHFFISFCYMLLALPTWDAFLKQLRQQFLWSLREKHLSTLLSFQSTQLESFFLLLTFHLDSEHSEKSVLTLPGVKFLLTNMEYLI